MIRDIAVRVLPYWNKLHSFFRFLEVIYLYDNLYDLATNFAVDPLSLNHGNAWAVHARAHCFEMTIQTSKGVNFMKSHEKSRDKARMLGGHNYWHWILSCWWDSLRCMNNASKQLQNLIPNLVWKMDALY